MVPKDLALADGFLAGLARSSAGHAEVDSTRLEAALAAVWVRCGTTWPALPLPPATFARFLGERVPPLADPIAHLGIVHAEDLYLACACALCIPAALEAFDRAVLAQVPAFVARIDRNPAFADEVRQILRERLLLAAAGDPARIAQFNGTSALASWVRVAATRTALNLRRSHDDQPGETLDEAAMAALTIDGNPEGDLARAQYAQALKRALRDAFTRLSREQRNVIRMHFGAGLTGDRIAALLQVSRSTVVRWLTGAREAMFRETQRLLSERLKMPARELGDFVDFVGSRFDASIGALLASTSGVSRGPTDPKA